MIKTGHHLSDAEIAARYDIFQGELAMRPYFYPAVAEFIGDISGQRVLDAGCGPGYLLAELRRRSPDAELYGLEMSAESVASARRRLGKGAQIVQGSLAGPLVFPPASFDVVILTEVIEHLKAPEQTLRHLTPLLRPGGEFIITFPNGAAWLPFSWPAAVLAPFIRPLRGFLPHEHPLRTEQPIDTVFSHREVFALLRRAGLKITRQACRETFPYLLEFLYKFARKPNPPHIWRALDQAVSCLGWIGLGYRVFVRCRPA